MLFNSINFLIFFSLVTSLYFLLPHKFRWILLLLSSCYFYMAFVPIYILILAFAIIIDYFAGIYIENTTGKKKHAILICSLAANIGILVLFKYYNFINTNLALLFNGSTNFTPLPYLNVLLPLGLTFHTFQGMSYNFEIYRGKQKAEKHFGIYALYVMFFPQLVAGPIERPQNVLHQYYERHDFDYSRVTNGLKLMLWGFFIKIVIADNLALVVSKIYDNHNQVGGLAILGATLAFSLQIYCDFSGYSAIAIGAAQVMGIKLMPNFRRPYFASSIGEFWTRWHISLSTWFKDYLYIPLGGNRVSTGNWIFNILIVFVISGLWHGANWTFIIWGAIHGFYLISSKMTNGLRNRVTYNWGVNKFPRLQKTLNIIFTFIIVAITWIFFRATNLHHAIYLVKNVLKNWHVDDLRYTFAALGRERTPKIIFLFFIIIMFTVEYYQEHHGSIRQLISKQTIYIRWGVYFFLLFSIFLFGAFENLSFIYFNF